MAGGSVVVTMSGDPDAIAAVENVLYAGLDKALDGNMECVEPTFGITLNVLKFNLSAEEADKMNRFALQSSNERAAASN